MRRMAGRTLCQTADQSVGSGVVDETYVAISFGGISLVQTGQSTAQSSGLNLAIASNNSQAIAGGIGSFAIATNNSYAAAAGGLLNTAIADNNSQVHALSLGIGNTVTARNGSVAINTGGNFNTVSATNNSVARVASGNRNTVTASDGSSAVVDTNRFDLTSNDNTLTVRCGGSVTLTAQSNQTVTSGTCETG
jgi:hypothetical protein